MSSRRGGPRGSATALLAAGKRPARGCRRTCAPSPNASLHMPEAVLEAVLGAAAARVSKPFAGPPDRRTAGYLDGRAAVATVSAQLDVTRRVLGGRSGSCVPQACEDIVGLGRANDSQWDAARDLRLPVPQRMECVDGHVGASLLVMGRAGGARPFGPQAEARTPGDNTRSIRSRRRTLVGPLMPPGL